MSRSIQTVRTAYECGWVVFLPQDTEALQDFPEGWRDPRIGGGSMIDVSPEKLPTFVY